MGLCGAGRGWSGLVWVVWSWLRLARCCVGLCRVGLGLVVSDVRLYMGWVFRGWVFESWSYKGWLFREWMFRGWLVTNCLFRVVQGGRTRLWPIRLRPSLCCSTTANSNLHVCVVCCVRVVRVVCCECCVCCVCVVCVVCLCVRVVPVAHGDLGLRVCVWFVSGCVGAVFKVCGRSIGFPSTPPQDPPPKVALSFFPPAQNSNMFSLSRGFSR